MLNTTLFLLAVLSTSSLIAIGFYKLKDNLVTRYQNFLDQRETKQHRKHTHNNTLKLKKLSYEQTVLISTIIERGTLSELEHDTFTYEMLEIALQRKKLSAVTHADKLKGEIYDEN